MEGSIFCIGAANIDIQGFSHDPVHLQDCNPGIVGATPGGVARNIAATLAHLQVPVELISAIGRDSYAQWIKRDCEELGILQNHMIQREFQPTATYLNLVDSDGGFILGLSDMRIIENIQRTDLMPFASTIGEAAFLVAECCLNDDVLSWLLSLERPLYLDPVSSKNCQRLKPFLSGITGLKLNAPECEALCGISALREKNLMRAADWLHSQGVSEVIITRGSESAFFSNGLDHLTEAAIPTTVRNSSGSGDTLLGAYLAFRYCGADPFMSFRMGLIAASLSAASEWPVSEKIDLHRLERIYRQYYKK